MSQTTPDDRLRLDAIAQLAQDVARDDFRDAGQIHNIAWFVRRTTIEVERWGRTDDSLKVATWCAGLGPRWAQRRTSLTGESCSVEMTALWVYLDQRGRPARIPAEVVEIYEPSSRGHKVGAKLLLSPESHPEATVSPWSVRSVDIDQIGGHVNNAVYWQAVEEVLAGRPPVPSTPLRATLEHRGSLSAGDDAELRARAGPSSLDLWVGSGPETVAVARLGWSKQR